MCWSQAYPSKTCSARLGAPIAHHAALRLAGAQDQLEYRVESADRSAEYYKGKTEEFKEIMMIMARTTEAIGDRDQPYSKRFTDFTTRPHALASIEDLTKIRDSLVSSAHELRAGVNQMALDGEEASRGCSKRWSVWDRWNA